jgi:hypothetical protein
MWGLNNLVAGLLRISLEFMYFFLVGRWSSDLFANEIPHAIANVGQNRFLPYCAAWFQL